MIRKSSRVEQVFGDSPVFDALTKMPYSTGIGAPSHSRQREMHPEVIAKTDPALAAKLRAQSKRVPVS
jgi:hypothetical protein